MVIHKSKISSGLERVDFTLVVIQQLATANCRVLSIPAINVNQIKVIKI